MNELNVNLQHSILALADNGWSNRRIARELGIHRETVGKHLPWMYALDTMIQIQPFQPPAPSLAQVQNQPIRPPGQPLVAGAFVSRICRRS